MDKAIKIKEFNDAIDELNIDIMKVLRNYFKKRRSNLGLVIGILEVHKMEMWKLGQGIHNRNEFVTHEIKPNYIG